MVSRSSEVDRAPDEQEREPWHALDVDDVCRHLDTSREGLDQIEAEDRLERYGPNEIQATEGVSPLEILLDQYRSALIWLLIVAAIVMFGVGHTIDGGVIVAIVVLITLFGFAQDYRAEQSIRALEAMATSDAQIRRDGEQRVIEATRLVPGDVIRIETGDVVPADARLLEESNLSTDESPLTGESVGASKSVDPVAPDAPLAERSSLVFKDTAVDRGSATAVVVGTGENTEIGRIATALESAVERETPLQEEIDRLGKLIAVGVVAIVTVIGVTELVIGDTDPFEVFLTAVGIAVSAVPEGLPAVVTLSLAIGARWMADRNALVRRLPIVEGLGSVDVICTDKTGTLTEGQMTVRELYVGDRRYSVTGIGLDTDGEIRPLTDSRREEIATEIDRMADDALRVMGFATCRSPGDTASEALERGMIFLGLQGMLDPPREEVSGAIEGCLSAGIEVVMITGDNAVTARAIAREIGLLNATAEGVGDRSARVVTGPELEAMDDETLASIVTDVTVFARTSPDIRPESSGRSRSRATRSR